jgi:hypothetical protein
MLLLLLVGATAGAPPAPITGRSGRIARPAPPVVVDEARRLEDEDEEAILLLLMAQAEAEEW